MRVQDHTKRENAKLGEIETRLAGKNGNKTQNYHFKDRLMLPQKKKKKLTFPCVLCWAVIIEGTQQKLTTER